MLPSYKKVLGATIKALLVVVCVVSLDAYSKEFYKWTDEKGTIHFTDKPPKNVIFEKVKGRNLASDDEDQQQDKADNSRKDAKRCKQEKARLNILKNNKRIQMKNRDGTVRDLKPEEIKSETEQTQKAVNVYC